MRRSKKRILVIVLCILVLAGAGVYAATNYGIESDPLITKSYLDAVVQPKLEDAFDAALDEAESALRETVPGEFTELQLGGGETILCVAGGELILRTGGAKTVGALSDTTSGSSVTAGSSAAANHLYLAAEADSGFTASSGGAVVLVSGSYTVK